MEEIKKDRENMIVTDHFKIKDNIMVWKGVMIQLSNVSYISTSILQKTPFPIWSLLLILVGLICLSDRRIVWLAILLFIVAGGWIYYWYQKNQEKSNRIVLNILLNAGNTISILFYDRPFLNEVLRVLGEIISEGGIGKKQIVINVKDNTFSGDATLLNELNIK